MLAAVDKAQIYACLISAALAPLSSNHLNISFVWKVLVASCVCVAELQTHIPSVHLKKLKCLLPLQNAFVSSAKNVHLQHKMGLCAV